MADERSHSPVRIAIAGAGPSGISLARILAREAASSSPDQGKAYPFSITISNRDLSPENPLQRPQGGQLDLHADSAQLALRRAGLCEGFVKEAHYDAQGGRVDDRYGKMAAQVKEEAGKERDKPELERARLTEILAHEIDRVDGISVNWGRKVVGVKISDARFRLVIEEDGKQGETENSFDLVVGADGTWSHVRPAVSTICPPLHAAEHALMQLCKGRRNSANLLGDDNRGDHHRSQGNKSSDRVDGRQRKLYRDWLLQSFDGPEKLGWQHQDVHGTLCPRNMAQEQWL